MNDVIKRITELRLIPVIKLNSPNEAAPMARALINGGLPIAEVTFRTDAAEESIKIMHRDYPDIFLGAGTVTTLDQAKRAVAAGACFLVGPGLSESVAQYAMDNEITYFPGVCTPTEIIKAQEYGINVVKFFPAKAFGGLAAIKAISAAFPGVRFVPTGGVNAENVSEYLSSDKVAACGGTWMVDNKLVSEGNWDEIERLIREAVEQIKKLSGE